MDSDFQQQQYQHHFKEFPKQFHHQKPQTSSLTRFQSAPSSYFARFLDAAADTINPTGGVSVTSGGERRDFPNARPLSPETENIFDRFMSNLGAQNNSSSQKLSNIPEDTAVQQDFTVRVKQEPDLQQQPPQQQLQQGNFNIQSQMIYHNQSKPPLSNQHNLTVSRAMQNSFTASSTGMAAIPQMKTDIGGVNNYKSNSSLTRYSSSPAGFFANLDIDTGYGIIGSGGAGHYGGGSGGNVEINYSSGQPSSTTGLMNPNTDAGGKIMRMNSLNEGIFNNQNNDRNSGYPMTSWNDSILSDIFSSREDSKPFTELASSEKQSGDGTIRQTGLTHHLSLPKTLPDLSAIENFLQFQDTVPCRIRAKRGCATHPRSIAERVRRTKISERMRKLQDLVPNMDKQTNTADMLDLAVDYIKDLQKQVETLNDNRAQCTCSI